MAIVTNWADGLKDALLEELRGCEASPEALRRLSENVEALRGTPVWEELAGALEEKRGALERRYLDALKQVQSGSIETTENGLRSLEELGAYKDAQAAAEKARARLRRLKLLRRCLPFFS